MCILRIKLRFISAFDPLRIMNHGRVLIISISRCERRLIQIWPSASCCFYVPSTAAARGSDLNRASVNSVSAGSSAWARPMFWYDSFCSVALWFAVCKGVAKKMKRWLMTPVISQDKAVIMRCRPTLSNQYSYILPSGKLKASKPFNCGHP